MPYILLLHKPELLPNSQQKEMWKNLYFRAIQTCRLVSAVFVILPSFLYVWYQIRLESKGGRHSSIVFCTNGVLLRLLIFNGGNRSKEVSSRAKDDVYSITHIIVVLHLFLCRFTPFLDIIKSLFAVGHFFLNCNMLLDNKFMFVIFYNIIY